MFALTTGLLFADQNLLAPNLSAAAKTFGFSDQERDRWLAGALAAVFFIVGAPASILVGYLMDRQNRVHLLLLCVLLGEGPCLATYLVTHYWQLFLTRMLTGVAVGGAAPIIYGLLSDLFPPRERPFVTTCVVISQGAGSALGQAIAGGIPGILPSNLDWRMPFVLVSVPALIVAAITAYTTEDPARGAAEPALRRTQELEGFTYDEHLSWRKLRTLCGTPTNLLIIFQGLPGCLPWGLIFAFLNDYLQDQGFSKPVATLIVMTFGSGGTLGCIVAGLVGTRLYAWRKGAVAVFMGVAVWLGMPAVFVLVDSPSVLAWPLSVLLAFTFLGGALASMAGVLVRPLVMNVNMPESRGVALALQATLDDLGKGLGPALVAVLISITSRITAFNIAIAGWFPCGLMMCLAGFTAGPDEAAVQRQLARVAAGALPGNDGFLATSTLEALATPSHSIFTDESQTPPARGVVELGVLGRGSVESKHVPHSVAEDVPLLDAS